MKCKCQNIEGIQFSSVAQSCLTLCDPMDRSTPGLPVHHQLLELAQTHVCQVSGVILPSDRLRPLFSCKLTSTSEHVCSMLTPEPEGPIRWPRTTQNPSAGTLSTAAAAESLQSCPTLCNPIDGSPPGSPVPGILQARTLERVAVSFSNAGK